MRGGGVMKGFEQEKAVLLEKKEAVAAVILNRPSALNAANEELIDALKEALHDVGNDDSIRVVVLTGNGRAFCAGGDLEAIKRSDSITDTHRMVADIELLSSIVMNMGKPVIAMVNGPAVGFGFNLALACDIIYCGKSAKFSQIFVNIGAIPDGGGTYLLPRIVGPHKAKKLMFTAEIIDAEKASELGIVNQVVEDDRLKEKTYELAEKLALGAPLPLRMIKQLVNRSLESSLETVLERERDLQTLCFHTYDCQEGVSAFFEKRRPAFKGK
jgi:2-(1,2-epoxy-1,2-dihydrophenyl)acetyl-CoA isomerase